MCIWVKPHGIMFLALFYCLMFRVIDARWRTLGCKALLITPDFHNGAQCAQMAPLNRILPLFKNSYKYKNLRRKHKKYDIPKLTEREEVISRHLASYKEG